MAKYTVKTQHTSDDRFIVGIAIEAETPLEAAQDRFERLSYKKGVTALLVDEDRHMGSSYVFPVVQTAPVVGELPVNFADQVGA
jgi:hypothetical protein